MYLMDSIIETAHMVRRRKMERHRILSVFTMLEDKLVGCPRFLFDETAINTAVEITLGRPKVLRDVMANFRIPYAKLWIEWPESGRQKLRDTFTPDETEQENPLRPIPKKLGFFLETDETGRKGQVTWAWNNQLDQDLAGGSEKIVNVCPISPFFDLDGDYPQDNSRYKDFLKANIANMWKTNAIQLDALQRIWRTAEHKPSEWGAGYLRLGDGMSKKYEEIHLNHLYADVYGEYIMIWSCLMLLTSSKKILDFTKVDNTKWNKSRVKQGKLPKLDHTVVSLHINQEIQVHSHGAPLGFTRKSPRIHMVSSYLARRGNLHWIVYPYWRGKGEIISRHVKVKT